MTDELHQERRLRDDSRYTRQSMFEMVADIQKKTGETHVALFGPPGQPDMGFVNQTNERLRNHGGRIGTMEKRLWSWGGAVGVISAALTSAVYWLFHGKN